MSRRPEVVDITPRRPPQIRPVDWERMGWAQRMKAMRSYPRPTRAGKASGKIQVPLKNPAVPLPEGWTVEMLADAARRYKECERKKVRIPEDVKVGNRIYKRYVQAVCRAHADEVVGPVRPLVVDRADVLAAGGYSLTSAALRLGVRRSVLRRQLVRHWERGGRDVLGRLLRQESDPDLAAAWVAAGVAVGGSVGPGGCGGPADAVGGSTGRLVAEREGVR